MILTPFERLVLRALIAILSGRRDIELETSKELDLAIRTSDGQQRANEANKALIP